MAKKTLHARDYIQLKELIHNRKQNKKGVSPNRIQNKRVK